MDFFEAQARAKRRTAPLVALFCLAVIGTIVALYFAFVGGTALLGIRSNDHGGGIERYHEYAETGVIDWWQPGALKAIILLVLPTVGLSALFKWSQLRAGGPAVAADVGGRRVTRGTTDPRERLLMNVVEEMAIASGMPVPAVFVLPGEASINAFAAGYTQSDAAVAVTRGALERLQRDELQGVVAHEFSHILNGDMRINTRLIAFLFGLLSLVILGRGLLRAAFYTGGSSKKGGGGAIPLAAGGLVLMTIGGLGLLAGRLIQAALSRQREYLADAAAVQFTRNPAGLSGALKKLGSAALGGRLSHPAANEVSHFCFAQNFRSAFLVGSLLATHPPLEERIRLLDPAFDGHYPDLPPLTPAATPPPIPRARPAPPPLVSPAALIATAGILNLDTVHAARGFIDTLPEELHDAAHQTDSVSALACAICLDPALSGAKRDQTLAIVTRHLGASQSENTGRLHSLLAGLAPGAGLSLLQLAAPALHDLKPTEQDTLLAALDDLVHADGVVCPREFALQKIIARDLRLSAHPREAMHSVAPGEASPHLSVALSFTARLDVPDDAAAHGLFVRAAMGFNGLQPPLAYVTAEHATLGHLDRALDKLALTPAPFRKRVLGAVATALNADNELSPAEADLLRAIAAALDCPIPPVTP
jgi:Zn-dependent protease with chaperone function